MKLRNRFQQQSLVAKTMWQFAICATVCFALAAPLFYHLTEHFYAEDMIDIIKAVKHGKDIPPIDFREDLVAGMMLQFLLIFLTICLSLFVTLRFATKRLWAPFDDTLRKVERFNLAQSEVPRFIETDVQEFARLNQSLTRLMANDKAAYRIQKEFTENASHELQTPLAILRSKLDLLMQEELTERETELVSDLYELVKRMESLNRNLLLLAKIENAQYSATEEVDPATLLTEALSRYEVWQANTAVHVTDDRCHPHRKLRCNPILLDSLLKNLIVNALRHSETGSEIHIILADEQLTVSNIASDGCPLDASTLFQRFRSGDKPYKGNGLGLAIVKAICDFHGWQLSYRFQENLHQFMVYFHSFPIQ